MDDNQIEEAIQEVNRQVAQYLFGDSESEFNYAGSYDDAWIVMDRMKREDPITRIRFFETIQALATKGAGIQTGVLSLSDSLFYTTPLTICLAALAVLVKPEGGGDIVQFGRKKRKT